jgi:hypothetical protein
LCHTEISQHENAEKQLPRGDSDLNPAFCHPVETKPVRDIFIVGSIFLGFEGDKGKVSTIQS